MTFVVDCKQTRLLLMTENKDNGVLFFLTHGDPSGKNIDMYQ